MLRESRSLLADIAEDDGFSIKQDRTELNILSKPLQILLMLLTKHPAVTRLPVGCRHSAFFQSNLRPSPRTQKAFSSQVSSFPDYCIFSLYLLQS